mmetsp:Transcript_22369/g.33284  ORF Transcript_22369/g.33284 Transcript_22369/m.33284 type:complete len:157 (-) Transcript_22369:280-750(-)|eukprot:CAMPEP_0194038360 /NCGR_PEP_ID=MMETSP0009_2-20130614/10603_1 /TAXON_ID=210454 /ORGANISM="Grammatophora oceanica, Strain CCMP 410" /LENGTH=156 /DNA_ID=CAMNT_0038680829 /DNA_START=22 /DNA_END=492 /DNA_ORIENTATION=-
MSSSSLVTRFKKIPVTLYRLQSQLPTKLRDYAVQMAAGRQSYDLHLNKDDGLVHPAHGDTFIGPNGMSLRPATENMLHIAKNYRGNVTVFRLSEGLVVPDGLILLHERDDHYSLQTDEPVPLETLNERITRLLQECPTQTRDQFVAQLEDPDDQDN